MTSAAPPDELLVRWLPDAAILRVVGRGSFKCAPAFKEFAAAALDRGARLLVLDLTACVGMDSTFMGVMAGLALRLRGVAGGRVVCVNLSPHTRGLLATLGLDLLVQTAMAGQTPPELQPLLADAPRQEIGGAPADSAAMLEAHENLVAASASNLPRFKDVLACLREDVRRHPAGKD